MTTKKHPDEEICNECGCSVAKGSGYFANRVPDFNSQAERKANNLPFPTGGYKCAECDASDSERRDKHPRRANVKIKPESKRSKEALRMESRFLISSVTRADVEQALKDAHIPVKKARRMALCLPDDRMFKLARNILEIACENGTYWEVCALTAKDYARELAQKRRARRCECRMTGNKCGKRDGTWECTRQAHHKGKHRACLPNVHGIVEWD